MTQNNKTKLPRVFFVITLIFAAAAAAGQTVVSLLHYDEALDLFDAGTNAPTILYAAVLIMCIAAGCSIFAVRDDMLIDTMQTSDRLTAFTALLAGFQLFAAAALNTLYYIKGAYTLATTFRGYFRVAALVAAVLAGCYFIVTALGRVKSGAAQFFGFFVIIWAALYLMSIYFDMESPLNSPVRILNQLALIGIMLAFLYEQRWLIDRPQPRIGFTVTLIAIILVALSSVSDIILVLMGVRANGKDTVFRITEAAIMLYMIARMRQMLWGKAEAAAPEPVCEDTEAQIEPERSGDNSDNDEIDPELAKKIIAEAEDYMNKIENEKDDENKASEDKKQ